MMPPAVVRALLTVLPPGTAVLPVGGVDPESMAGYWQAGAAGFGLGSALYRAGMPLPELARRARRFVDTLAGLRQGASGPG